MQMSLEVEMFVSLLLEKIILSSSSRWMIITHEVDTYVLLSFTMSVTTTCL